MLHKAVRTIYGACPVHVGPASVVWLVREKLAKRVEVLASRTWVEPRRLAEAKAAHDAALAKWKTLRRVVRDVADVCAETTDDDVDVAHLAGVFTDREAGVAGPDPVPFGAA